MGTEEVRPHATERETILPIESHGLQTMSIGYLLEEDSPVIWRGPMVTGLLRQFLFQSSGVIWISWSSTFPRNR